MFSLFRFLIVEIILGHPVPEKRNQSFLSFFPDSSLYNTLNIYISVLICIYNLYLIYSLTSEWQFVLYYVYVCNKCLTPKVFLSLYQSRYNTLCILKYISFRYNSLSNLMFSNNTSVCINPDTTLSALSIYRSDTTRSRTLFSLHEK